MRTREIITTRALNQLNLMLRRIKKWAIVVG